MTTITKLHQVGRFLSPGCRSWYLRTLAEAWIGEGIRINGIAPGFVRTKLTKITTDDPERREVALKRVPAGRFGTPEEIASVALFLASPMSSYIVGQTICVDGGLLLL